MSPSFIIGYDPGGNDRHGVAALQVGKKNGRWTPIAGLEVTAARSLRDAIDWLDGRCHSGRIVAAGIDTLTEWNSGPGGWRPADLWLRRTYTEIRNSVVSPNHLCGSMAVNGAAFLTLLAPRFQADGTAVTEAHPKACYFAVTGRKHAWVSDRSRMAKWLLGELGIDMAPRAFGKDDHCFDAALALLAAVRGLNQEWTLDLHALPNGEDAGRVQFFGHTRFWWPRSQAGSTRRRG